MSNTRTLTEQVQDLQAVIDANNLTVTQYQESTQNLENTKNTLVAEIDAEILAELAKLEAVYGQDLVRRVAIKKYTTYTMQASDNVWPGPNVINTRLATGGIITPTTRYNAIEVPSLKANLGKVGL